MAQNFIEGCRDQGFLLPPDVRDWLPADHLAWFVVDAVAQIDLMAIYGAYRADGHGAAAYEPSMMVTLLLYAYATGQRSSRAIECHCRQDVAYRVITGNAVPDHATIARFVVRHEAALAELFGEVLKLCDRGGLVKAGVVAIDGTRLAGNASKDRNRGFERIAKEILAEAKAADEAEDQQHGEERGDELPERLRTAQGRREFFREVKDGRDPQSAIGEEGEEQPAGSGEAQASEPAANNASGLDTPNRDARGAQGPDREAPAAQPPDPDTPDTGTPAADTPAAGAPGNAVVVYGFEERARDGRDGWLREARRQLEARRWQAPEAIPRDRLQRLLIAAERLEDELDAECAGNAAYERYRANGRMKDGRRFGCPPKPYTPPQAPEGKVNISDPDSHYMKKTEGYVQGYNAQAVVTENQIVLAAEITTNNTDWSQLAPMVSAAIRNLEQVGCESRPQIALADAQYWNEQHIDEVIANQHVQVLIPPESRGRDKPRPGWTGGRYDWMRTVLKADVGKQLYRKRPAMIEPVFGHTKHNRHATRFLRRGRSAVRTEWRLLMATHNLTKLHRHHLATAGP